MINMSRVGFGTVAKLSKACFRPQSSLFWIFPTWRHCEALEMLCRKGLLRGHGTSRLNEDGYSSVTFKL